MLRQLTEIFLSAWDSRKCGRDFGVKLVCVSLCLSNGFAETTDTTEIALSDWVHGSKAISRIKMSGGILSVAVVKRVGKSYETVNLDADIGAVSYLESPSESHSRLTLEINKANGQSQCTKNLIRVAQCLDVDMLLDVSKRTWELYYFDRAKNTMRSMIKKERGETGRYFDWIEAALNYDGIILERKGANFLAVVPTNAVAGETQVLALANSSNKQVLEPGAFVGSALLTIKKREGRFAILQMLVNKDDPSLSIKPGDKIILEKAKRSVPTQPADSTNKNPPQEPSNGRVKQPE
jgi:hypothetical protein